MDNLKENINYIILGLSPFIVYYIYYVITTELTPTNYPPRIAKCPDYWVYNKAIDGNENKRGCFGSAYPNYSDNISNYNYTADGFPSGFSRAPDDASFNFNVGDISNSSINSSYKDESNRRYINFDSSYSTLCEKYEWTQRHGISWSGISSLDKNICIDTSPNVKLDTSKDVLDDFRKYNAWHNNKLTNNVTWHKDTAAFRDREYIRNKLSYIIIGTIFIGIIVAIKICVFPNDAGKNKRPDYTSIYILIIIMAFLIINQII